MEGSTPSTATLPHSLTQAHTMPTRKYRCDSPSEFDGKNRSALLANLSHSYSANGTANAEIGCRILEINCLTEEKTMQHTSKPTMTKTARTLPPFASDDARWEAVVRRDHAADDVFYYSVQTTGVYCRPSCAARLARREHVRFHATCAEAEQAGFRPCKRCRPQQSALAA